MTPSTRHRTRLIIGAVLLAVATIWATFPQAAHLHDAIGVHYDSFFNIWRLAWVAHQLPREPAHLFDANIFFPSTHTLLLSDAMLLPGIASMPLQAITHRPELVYNVALLTAFWLSAVGCFLLVEHLTDDAVAGFVAALAFAFCAHRFEHYEHLEIQTCVWIPLSLLALHRLCESGEVRYGAAFGLAFSAQVFSGVYHAVFLAIFLAVFVPVLLWQHRDRAARACAGLVLGVFLVTILSGWYALAYKRASAEVGERSRDDTLMYSASASDYFSAHSNWGGVFPAPRASGLPERALFPGYVALVLAFVGLTWRRNWKALPYVVGLLIAIECSRGLHSSLYTVLFEHVLFLRGLRVPARFGILVQLSLAVLAGFGVGRLRAVGNARRAGLVTIVIAALAVAEYHGRPQLKPVPQVSLLYRHLAGNQQVHVLELPIPQLDALDRSADPEFMFYSTRHWQPLLNGYSGFFPEPYAELLRTLPVRRFPGASAILYLVQREIDLVLVHEKFMTHDEYQTLTEALLRSPRFQRLFQYSDTGTGEITAYRLIR